MNDVASRYRDFLILLWQHGFLQDGGLTLADGTPVEILRPGTAPGRDEGPDFAHAAIHYPEIDLTLHGSVKVDCRSSDWRTAGDVSDPAFDGLILHVVAEHDHLIMRNERAVPTLVVVPPPRLEELYRDLLAGRSGKSCVQFVTGLDPLYRDQIVSRVMSDRLNRKSGEILDILDSVGGDWHETTYIAFMRAFGYKERKKAYEQLARSMPYRHLRLHSDNRLSLEAMLLGQAGYLEIRHPDDYTRQLQDEYISLRRRYNLLPHPLKWRVEAMRPQFMPAQSLARIASILAREESLLERVLTSGNVYELTAVFDILLPEYWQGHYVPSHPSSGGPVAYGTTRRQIDLLMINFVIPLWVAYGIRHSNEELREKALDLYESIKPEENRITRHWASEGMAIDNAFVSQAVIQIATEYCSKGLCASCPVGAERLRRLHRETVRGPERPE